MQSIEVEGQLIPVIASILPNGTSEYTDQFVEYVFSIYAGDGSRSVRMTRELLAERHDLRVSETTVYRWRNTGNWDARARELYQLLRPSLVNQSLDNLMTGAVEGSALLMKMARGEIATDAAQAKVIFGLLDRVGLMPHSAVAEHIRLQLGERKTDDVSALSNAELAELEASYQPSGVAVPDAEIPEAQLVLAAQRRSRRE